MDQRRARPLRSFEQQLDPAAAVLDAAQPRRHHPRVVEHHQIGGLEQRRKIAELPVLECAVGAVEHQHSAGGALGRRALAMRSGGRSKLKSVRRMYLRILPRAPIAYTGQSGMPGWRNW